MQNKPKGPSWAAIIILIVLFWPVGFYLLFKKLTIDKTAIFKNSMIMFAISGFFFLVTLRSITLYTNPLDVGSLIFSLIFFLGGGILIARKGLQMRKTGHRYKKYISLIVNQGVDSIDIIASTAGVSYDQCVKDLEKMISLDYFHNAYIDAGNGRIVLQSQPAAYAYQYQQTPQHVYQGQQTAYQNQQPAYQAPPQPAAPAVVQCKSCGANNMLGNGHNECEYCGSPLA